MRPPVGLRNRWLSKEGTKGTVVIVVFVGVFGAFGCCHLCMAEASGGGGPRELDFGAWGGRLS